ncbi:MAG: NADH-quinone oxidoreductase subunit J [Verrucomicrobia bacterium]|nr:NADH-quinone oxidoreductase subunit J [Verrucomicrobiota bacterium]
MHDQLFWFFSIAMLLSGLLVILGRNPVTSAMFLVLSLFFMAGLFVLLEAYFLAIIQILVYAGAVIVLFLFVIMLLDLKTENVRQFKRFGVFGALVVAGALAWKLTSVVSAVLAAAAKPVVGTTEAMGKLLFTQYLLPFEVTSVLLLIAMVGVVVLSRKETK